jgi:hypothetical protein
VVVVRPLMSIVVLAALVSGLAACTVRPVRPDQFASTDTLTLCRAYYMLSHPSYLDPEIKGELIRRGAEICVDPTYIAEKQREIW